MNGPSFSSILTVSGIHLLYGMSASNLLAWRYSGLKFSEEYVLGPIFFTS
uniref:Uncharacterized protein n=1 Tax=Human betaherpesvirus 6 TaxID=10368 RepID=A0A5P9S7N6_9BETA|nr:hypothetical protein [Human betaherpesvirus 6]QFV47774.1 hypothetical protein [Human betaherpesvirus 6]QFV49781.1 hypothetical protein [Human betaherpesvirus 6]